MSNVTKQLKLFVLTLIGAVSVSVTASTPSYIAKMNLNFLSEPSCVLEDFPDAKNTEKGRSNLKHDKNSITWTSTCVIKLPKTVKFCVQASREVSNNDAILSSYTGFQKKVLRAKLVSESDINPDFGALSVSYLCFE